MKVKDAMHHYAFSVHPNSPISEVTETMRIHDVGAIPVIEDHKISGIITDRDVAIRAFFNGRDPLSLKARDIMSENVIRCRDAENLTSAIRTMEKNKIRRLPVVDQNDLLIGMLSLGDLAHVSSSNLIAGAVMSVAEHHDSNSRTK